MSYYSVGVGLGLVGATIAVGYLAKKCTELAEGSQIIGVAKYAMMTVSHPDPIQADHAFKLLNDFNALTPSLLNRFITIAHKRGWINEDTYLQYQSKYGFCISTHRGNVYGIDPNEVTQKINKAVLWGIFPDSSPYMLLKYTIGKSVEKIVSLSEGVSKKLFIIGDSADCFKPNGIFCLENPEHVKNLNNLLENGTIVKGSLTIGKEVS